VYAFSCICTLAACAGNGPPPAPTNSSFDSIQQTIFNVRCLNSGCHNVTDRAGDLVLDAGTSYAALIEVAPFNPAAHAAELRRVAPGNPEQSFLLIKLTGPGPAEGTRMPQSAAPLSEDDIARVRAWILAGAPNSNLPTATATATASPTDSALPTPTVTASMTPTTSATPTITPTGTLPFTVTPTATPPHTASPTVTATVTETATPSAIPTPTFSLDSTFPQIQATIFNVSCLDLGCHNATGHQGAQVLEAGQAYTDLVGVVPQNPAAAAAGMLRVDPGKPENSFLITKLTLPKVFDLQFSSRMPSGKPPLDPTQIEHIRAWILRGALEDEQP